MLRAARHLFIALAIGGATFVASAGADPVQADIPPVRIIGLAGNKLLTILGLGTGGKITLFSEAGTHLLTDVTGYFLS